MMEIEKFIDLVERMREAQRNWFATHKNNFLQRSIILEGLCDKMLQEYREEEKKNKPQEQDLFAGMMNET